MSTALAALPRAMRRIGLPRIPPRILLAAILAVIVAVPAWLWFRDSSLVRVRDVFVTGVETGDGPRIRSALRSAAQDMTTLNVREDALRAAVGAYPSVASLHVEAGFPHKLTIEVVEHVPVASVEVNGRRVPAAGSGLLLHGAHAGVALPVLQLKRGAAGERVTDARALVALALLGAAPEELRPKLERAWFDSRGLVVTLRQGPDLIFGNAERARPKWLAAARVLADPGAAGAVYLDVRIPERVAAGGVGDVPTDDPTAAVQPAAEVMPAATATVAPAAIAPPVATATPMATATPAPTAAAGVQTPVPNPQP
jgi:cell division protein FtsQ